MSDRILVVEDSRPQALAAKLTLSKSGYEVTVAEDGQDGLEKVAAGQFDSLNNSNLVGPAESDPEVTVLKVGLSDESLGLFRDWYDQANGTWVVGQSMNWMGVIFVAGGGGLIAWDLLARPQEVPVNGE